MTPLLYLGDLSCQLVGCILIRLRGVYSLERRRKLRSFIFLRMCIHNCLIMMKISLEICCLISKENPLLCPKEVKFNKKSSAKESEKKKGIESRNERPKGKKSDCCWKGEFIKGQHVYYFPTKNHFLYNPKISIGGPFMISKVHSFGPIDIILHDHKLITVYKKHLKIFKGSTTRSIWRPK